MVRHKSALKAARQAEKRRLHNNTLRSNFKTVVKKLRTELANAKGGKANKEGLMGALNQVQSVLMKAANRNLIKHRGAARRISRLSADVSRAVAG
ncbi:30S ribosomal protein S20 [bacterium]|nr:30S ribosomal protein S20 [bacterium]